MSLGIAAVRTTGLALVFGIAPVFAAPASAQSASQPPRTGELVVTGGGAMAQSVYHSAGHRQLLLTGLAWGWDVGGRSDHGRLLGLEMLVEVVPALVVFQSTTVWGAGVNPIFLRWNSSRSGVAPYVEWAGGIAMMASRVPESASRFNFTTQAGIGVRLPIAAARDVLVGYRFHHLSNGNTAESNPGINSHMVQIGVSFRSR